MTIAAILIIVTIAIPGAMAIKNHADETAVMREMQTIHQAQMQYLSQFGKYATTLMELSSGGHGDAGPGAANLIPRKLATGEKNGFIFAMTANPAGYTVTAVPKNFGSTGRRTFYIDQTGILHQNWGREAATENSPEVE